MSQFTPYSNGVVGIAQFTTQGTVIHTIKLLGAVEEGKYCLAVFAPDGTYDVLDAERFLALSDTIRELIAKYPNSRLQQIEADALGAPAVQSLDEVYADVDKEAEKYRALLEALVDQSQDQDDLPE